MLCNIVRVCVILVVCLSFTKSEPLSGKHVKRVAQHDLDFVASIAYQSTSGSHRKDNHICSGTLISPRHILTHERCLLNKIREHLAIYVGSPDIKSASPYHACKWISYSSWYSENTNRFVNIGGSHIAIITICMNVVPAIAVPAPISPLTYDELEGSGVTVAGWGLLKDGSKSSYLKKATVKLLTQNTCNEFHHFETQERDRYLCTRSSPYVIVKPGDAGGPILDTKKRVIGVTSGSFWHGRSNDPEDAINIHVNISYYRTFIQETTGLVF
ncbi:hypothetical protein QAD02_006132 [Eretmocerus hayati]|uniref:Uncharacterized protein n=1 Tax=Eretmocerus hayati TaxID=131215 RepID=A0ACC2N456_9HYME|nr:hypothetical protein QAD02_006132 [Eretmocerus hayati]